MKTVAVITAEKIKRVDWSEAHGSTWWECQLACGHRRDIVKPTAPVRVVCPECLGMAALVRLPDGP